MKAPVSTKGIVLRLGVGTGFEQNLDDQGLRLAGRRQRSVQRGFARAGFERVGVGTLFEEELTEAPVFVKGGGVQAEVFAERF
jgi:hypothetical protein